MTTGRSAGRWPLAILIAAFVAIGAAVVLRLPTTPGALPERPEHAPAPLLSQPSVQQVAPPLEADVCDLPPEAGWIALDRRAVAGALGTNVEGAALALPTVEGALAPVGRGRRPGDLASF